MSMLNNCGDTEEFLYQVQEQLPLDISKLHDFVHGTEVETVNLAGQETPTLRKMVHDIDERESGAAQAVVDEAIAKVVVLKNKATAEADRAEAAAMEIKSVSAFAETVDSNQAATAQYDPDTGALTFKIPRGEQGIQGQMGPQGQAPAIDVINCGGAAKNQITVISCGNASFFKE